jgi:hypothetical protein
MPISRPPTVAGAGGHGEVVHLEPRRERAGAVVGHRQVVGMAGGRALQQHPPRAGEGREHVDVPVRVAVLDEPVAEPDDLPHAEEVPQPLLELLARPRRIAVGMQQALLRGEQRPAPSTRIAPPSSTKGALNSSSPACSTSRAPERRVAA